MPARRLLLGLAGLEIDGGIASVSRCIARVLDETANEAGIERADRVLLHDAADPPPAAPTHGEQFLAGGSQARFAWQLWRAVRRRRPDLVFFDQVGLARSAHLPLPGLPPRYAVFCHGMELERAASGPRARALHGAWRLLANSEYTGRQVREQFPAVADRVRVVPLCIDPRRTETWERNPPPDPGAARPPAVLIIGRLWSEERGKGHDALVAAWPRVRQAVPEAELWIVGEGDDRPRLEALARTAGLGGCIRFLGRADDAELARLYRSAALFAMPSRQEGFGLVYAEALWHGTPCIASTADAAGEVVTEGKTGSLVPYDAPDALAEAVVALLTDPARRARLGSAGMQQARERFGYRRFKADLKAALEL
ncbi:MAG: glycosyltransferase family 4 protein [Myxococcota bacterium]|nr:glycosyltransferase family 4 protein [Myxococcota bacterium]